MTNVKNFAPSGALLPADLNNIQADYEDVAEARTTVHSFSTHSELSAWTTVVGNQYEVGPQISGGTVLIFPSMYFYYDPADYLTVVTARTPKLMLRGTYLRGSTTAGVTAAFQIVKIIEPLTAYNVNLLSGTVSALGTSISFSPADASSTTKTAVMDTSTWTPGIYGVRQTNTGTNSGLPWSVVGAVFAYAS